MSSTDNRVKFRTKDLNQAAFIWSQDGGRLIELAPHDERAQTFFFEFELPITEVELRKLIFNYVNGDTLVDPVKFSNCQSQLRDMLHSTLNRQRT